MKPWMLIPFILLHTIPAHASVAFEDHATLSTGGWQLNSIGSLFQNTWKFEGGNLTALPSDEAHTLFQFAQEFRYGLTDWLMIRTTVPVSLLIQPQGKALGLGDWEAFLKAQLLQGPLALSLGLQVMVPTAIPAVFAINGSTNLSPSLMVSHEGDYGSANFTASYTWGTDQIQDGKRFHPSDGMFCGLALTRNLMETVSLTLESLLSWGFPSVTDGVADPGTQCFHVCVGPGMAWEVSPGHTLLASLQVPVWRHGTFPVTQPYFGFVQYSRDF